MENEEVAAILVKEKVLNFPVYKVKEESGELKNPGGNKKEIMILFRNDSGESLNEKDEIFLKKILEALKVRWEDAALLNHHRFPLAMKKISRDLPCQKVIICGVSPKEMGLYIEAEKYRQVVLNDVRMIFADTLEIVAENKKREKNLLWEALQKMFGMK